MYSDIVYYCILIVFCIVGLRVLHGLINLDQSINQSINLTKGTSFLTRVTRSGFFYYNKLINFSQYLFIFHWLPEGLQVFFKVLSVYTRYTLSVPPYQPSSTGSGSVLGVTAIDSKCQLLENIQNISTYTVHIDMSCTLSSIWHFKLMAVTRFPGPRLVAPHLASAFVLWYR